MGNADSTGGVEVNTGAASWVMEMVGRRRGSGATSGAAATGGVREGGGDGLTWPMAAGAAAWAGGGAARLTAATGTAT